MRDSENRVIEDFAVPPRSPASVLDAHAGFSLLVEQLREARSALGAAEDSIEEGHREDIRELSDAFKAGNTAAVLASTNEQRARQAAHEARARIEALERAVDESGSAVCAAIDEEQTAWLLDLRDDVDTAEREYVAAIDQARESLLRLAESRYVAAWLERFNAHKMERGNAPPGTARVMSYREAAAYEVRVPAGNLSSQFTDTVDAATLIDAAARAVDRKPAGVPA